MTAHMLQTQPNDHFAQNALCICPRLTRLIRLPYGIQRKLHMAFVLSEVLLPNTLAIATQTGSYLADRTPTL